MIGADDQPAVAAAFEQRRAAVAAGIGEGAQLALVVEHDDRHASESEGEVIAGIAEPVGGPDEVPCLMKDAFHLAAIERFRGVAPHRHGLGIEQRAPHRLVMPGIENVGFGNHPSRPSMM